MTSTNGWNRPPGPTPLAEDDAWAKSGGWFDPNAKVSEAERYRGRRRLSQAGARLGQAGARYAWWIGGGVGIVVLVAMVASLISQTPSDQVGSWSPSPGAEATDASGLPAASQLPVAASSPPVSSAAAAPFALTLESEAGALGGSARIANDDRASGGKYVTGLGDRDNGSAGTLKFTGIAIPSDGSYRIEMYYLNEGSSRSRTAIITTAKAVRVEFSGNPKCCGVQSIVVNLTEGAQSITIGNPDGAAPSFDKIVITRA